MSLDRTLVLALAAFLLSLWVAVQRYADRRAEKIDTPRWWSRRNGKEDK